MGLDNIAASLDNWLCILCAIYITDNLTRLTYLFDKYLKYKIVSIHYLVSNIIQVTFEKSIIFIIFN